MVLLFVFCALLPITALAIISFSHVRKQLNEQGEKRLHQANKIVGMDVYERLLFLEAEMGVIAFKFSKGDGTKGEVRRQGNWESFRPQYLHHLNDQIGVALHPDGVGYPLSVLFCWAFLH